MKIQRLFILNVLLLLFLAVSCCKEEEPMIPEAAPNEKFAGAYNVTQTGDRDFDGFVDDTNYTLTISTSAVDDERIILSNVGAYSDIIVDADVTGDSFTIPQQSIDFTSAVLGVSGSGSITGASLTFSYQISWQGSTYDYSCTGTKR